MSMNNKISMFFIVTTIILLYNFENTESAGPVEAPSPGEDCSSVIPNMANCLSFVREGSKVTKPEVGCCSGLKMVLKTDPECLCEGLKASSDFGFVLNMTKALTLPSACHVHAPHFSGCGVDQLAPSAPKPPTTPASSPRPIDSSPNPVGSSSNPAGSSPSPIDTRELAPAAAPANSATPVFAISLVFPVIVNLVTVFFSLL